jgi:mercuric ion transport protein
VVTFQEERCVPEEIGVLVEQLNDVRNGSKTGTMTLVGGAVAALLASLCCLGPLVLVLLGMSGAWIGNLTALEPYRPWFLGVAVVCMAFAYRQMYRAPAADTCEAGTLCARPQTNRLSKGMFWVVSALVLVALVFPYLMPLFY